MYSYTSETETGKFMSYFDQRPQMFRLFYGILATLLIVFTTIDVYKFGRSPTDENLFQDTPSDAFFTATIPAELWNEKSDNWMPDSIRAGDLPRDADGKNFKSLDEARHYLAGLKDTALVTIRLLRPDELQNHVYRLRRSALLPDQVRQLESTAWVTAVTEGGASDRAGMKVGDLITRINGKTFKNANEADRILRSGQIGKAIDYDVLRKGKLLTLHVTLASFGLQFAFLLFIISGLFYMATGVFIAELRPGFAGARLLGLFFLVMGFFMTLAVVNRGIDDPLLLAIRNWALPASLFSAFALFLHFHHYFPKERPDLLQRKWIRGVGYIIAIIGTIGIGIRILPGWMQTTLIISAGIYPFVVPLPFRKSCPTDYKLMNRLTKWTGITIGLVSILFGVTISQLGQGSDVLTALGAYSIVLLLFPITYLYTIGRYRLFNLALRVRRNVQYSLVSVAWSTIALLVFVSLLSWMVQANLKLPFIRITGQSIEVVDSPTSQREQSMIEKALLAALVIGATLTLSRVYKGGKLLIGKKFYRTRYDYRRAASELAEAMSTTLSMTALARGIVERLAILMQVKRVGLLFFRDESICCCHEAHGFEDGKWNDFCMRIDETMVNALRQFTGEARVQYLPPELKGPFHQLEFHHVVPILSKEKFVGAILIGEKMSEAPFQTEDLEFLSAVAKQASVAIENAFLYEELTEQERLKHELAIARKIQLESLPQSTPNIAGLEIAGVSIPALEVGGDYFDYLNGDPHKLTVIVGDVSGKGTSAALYMSKVQGILRSLHGFGLAPRDLFIRANHLLCRDLEKKSFVTAMGALFDTNAHSIDIARAGHLPLFRFNASLRAVERITPKGLGLGLSPEDLFANELEQRHIGYERDDVFVFVTDGITEGQQTSGDEFGEERLERLLEGTSTSSAATIRDRIIHEVRQFAGGANQHDDQTVVVVKVL
jgi:phosphoserine phosphatase RsbU/P